MRALKKKLKTLILKNQNSTSQLGQDLWVLKSLEEKTGGYFVEIGAGDGVYLSNTYILEKRYGWKGICVEPMNKIEDLKKNRACIIDNSCLYSRTGLEVEFQSDEEISGIINDFDKLHNRKGEIVKLITLSFEDLLKKHNAPREIDYLSIDTEGSEYEILRTFPFDKYRIELITVEHNANSGKEEDIEKRDKIHKLLSGNGFVCEKEGEFEDWWRCKKIERRLDD